MWLRKNHSPSVTIYLMVTVYSCCEEGKEEGRSSKSIFFFFFICHIFWHTNHKHYCFNTLDSAVLTAHYCSKTEIHLDNAASVNPEHRSDNMMLSVATVAQLSPALLSASVTLSSLALLSGVFPLS